MNLGNMCKILGKQIKIGFFMLLFLDNRSVAKDVQRLLFLVREYSTWKTIIEEASQALACSMSMGVNLHI